MVLPQFHNCHFHYCFKNFSLYLGVQSYFNYYYRNLAHSYKFVRIAIIIAAAKDHCLLGIIITPNFTAIKTNADKMFMAVFIIKFGNSALS